MIDRILDFNTRQCLFAEGQRLGVAVSGGADSVFLLHVLHELAASWRLQLLVLHVNHGLRGAESDGDEAFVRELAAQLGWPCEVERASLPQEGNLEQNARLVRYDFLRRSLQTGAVDRVALGHTRSDQAETVLFRFLRGAGTAGLAAVRPATSDGFIRPILHIGRNEVLLYLTGRNLSWREDSSNRSLTFDRNRIRLELLPQLTADWNPALEETLAHTADWAVEEEAYWQQEIDRLAPEYLESALDAVICNTRRLRELPRAVARRLLREAVRRVKGDLRSVDFSHVCAVEALILSTEGHGRTQLPGVDVMRSFEWLRFGAPMGDGLKDRNWRFPLPLATPVPVPGSHRHVIVTVAQMDCVYNEEEEVGVDAGLVPGPLELRNWRPGDQYQPAGASGSEKIKMLFQQERVPLWERRNWPIVEAGGCIIWARQFGIAANYAARGGSRQVFRIRECAGGV